MSVLTDIQQMQKEGHTEEEIMSLLKQRGISPREISEALAQSKIKEAVSGYPEPQEMQPSPQMREEYAPSPQMQQQPIQQPYQAPPTEPYPAQPAEQYPEYQQYAPQQQLSSDVITEISEQVVAEKLSPLKNQLEKVIELKTTVDAKIEYLDERLKRIEKIIDRLQVSILQKVGEYITNVDDIKKEIVETQKSFKALLPSKTK